MLDATRIYYLGLSALATVLCWYMAMPTDFTSSRWWLWVILAAYAIQPWINAARDLLDSYRAKRRAKAHARSWQGG